MSDDEAWGLFEEPAGFRPPTPPPTFAEHALSTGEVIRMQLVGSHPLWGHYLWNAAPTLTDYIEAHPALVQGRSVLELGAAAALPSMACAKLGAKCVVATDYPDPGLMKNVATNLEQNGLAPPQAVAVGYTWGADPAPLLAHAPQGFELVIMSDLIFNHQAHGALLDTVEWCLAPGAASCVLVFFSHHRPHLADKDLAFFDRAAERGFVCDKLREWVLQVRNAVVSLRMTNLCTMA